MLLSALYTLSEMERTLYIRTCRHFCDCWMVLVCLGFLLLCGGVYEQSTSKLMLDTLQRLIVEWQNTIFLKGWFPCSSSDSAIRVG